MAKNILGAAELESMLAAASPHADGHYVLRLYIVGTTAHSTRAIVNIRKLCQQYLHGRHDLVVVDISLQPALAKGQQIIAAPTLMKILPLPARRFIGDMSQTESILRGLGLHEDTGNSSAAKSM